MKLETDTGLDAREEADNDTTKLANQLVMAWATPACSNVFFVVVLHIKSSWGLKTIHNMPSYPAHVLLNINKENFLGTFLFILPSLCQFTCDLREGKRRETIQPVQKSRMLKLTSPKAFYSIQHTPLCG